MTRTYTCKRCGRRFVLEGDDAERTFMELLDYHQIRHAMDDLYEITEQ